MAQFPGKTPKKITDDPYGALVLIHRLVTEQGIVHWRRYLVAFALMAAAAPLAMPGPAGLALGLIAGVLAMLVYLSATMLGGVAAALRDNPHLASKG